MCVGNDGNIWVGGGCDDNCVFFWGGQCVRVIFGWGVEGGDGNFWVGGKGVIVSFWGGWVRV